MAQRAGVDKRQLIATALTLYCQRRVPQELVEFRQKIYSDAAREIYRKHRVSVRKALRTRSAHLRALPASAASAAGLVEHFAQVSAVRAVPVVATSF